VKVLEKTYIIILVTAANKQEAEEIAQQLLKAKLIACANIIDSVSSIFRWSGKIEKAEECLMLMKSRRELFEEIAETIKELHSYEVPEILAISLVNGSNAYFEWMDSCLKQHETTEGS
jgi:periplasmic divalent cation tolerance protein